MSLQPGTKLGVYEITAQIGAGGMGEVYRAHDTTLDRDVAIKVLPDAFATDPERLARFEREAKVLASLNHPNIAAIYGLEKSGETPALILELVEGPTLQDLISPSPGLRPSSPPSGERGKGKPLPLEEALPVARQIAEALEAAHERGIIHRDPQAGQRQSKARRHGQSAGLRPGEGARTGPVRSRRGELAHDDDDGRRHEDGRHHGDGGVYAGFKGSSQHVLTGVRVIGRNAGAHPGTGRGADAAGPDLPLTWPSAILSPFGGEGYPGKGKPLPLEEALPVARQIAEALEAAHERGIIHRDLKPANVKVKPDGTVRRSCT